MGAFTTYDPGVNAPSDLVNAVLVSSPGIAVDFNSVQFVGSNSQVSFYDGTLASVGASRGILLTSGDGTPNTSNTASGYGETAGTAGDSDLDGALVAAGMAAGTQDAAYLEFSFTVADPNVKSITFDLVFGSEEYPEYADSIVDIAGVFVNGVNYALFGNDPNQPLSVLQRNIDAGHFLDNQDGSRPIEYDGLSIPLSIVAPVSQGVNTIKIAIADTSDSIFDSGLFVSNLKGFTGTGGGIIVNRPPTLTASLTSASYTDAAGDDSFAPVAGLLSSTDPDSDDSRLFGVTGGSVSSARTGYDLAKVGTFGTLYVNSATGAYLFEPDDAAIEGLKTDDIERFSLTVMDGSGASDSQFFTISITGANDTPALAASATGAAFTNTPADDTFAAIAGQLTSTDRDVSDLPIYGVSGGTVASPQPSYDVAQAGTYGTLHLNSATGAYLFVPDDAAIEALNANTAETFTLTVTDGSGAAASRTFMVDLKTPNVPPVLNLAPLAADDLLVISEDRLSLEARRFTGNVLSNDRDPNEDDSLLVSAVAGVGAAVGQRLQGKFGTLSLRADGSYSYSLANTDALIRNEEGVERFTYTISDSKGLISTATLVLTIQGSDLELSRNGAFTAHRGADRLTGGQEGDRFAGRGGHDVLSGGEGDDILWGEDGDDQLLGEDGADRAVGGTGRDVIWLGEGDDRGWGEAGDDTLYGEAGDDVVDGGDGNDRVWLGSGDDQGFGGLGHDRLFGDTGHDQIDGGDGDDTVDGASGNDKIWGGEGVDTLRGGRGADQFSGGAGSDLIFLDDSNDTAWGGDGNDRFVFSRGCGEDRIKDFQSGDQIVLKGVFKSFAQVEDRMSVVGDDVVIEVRGKGNTIMVENVGNLGAQDFEV